MRSIPHLAAMSGAVAERLQEIPGMVPALSNLPGGCAFAARCGHADAACAAGVPPLEERRPDHYVACWHAGTLV